MIKLKKPQGGGTVRNIPIKDYRASIAMNFGTLRKSVLPHQQFESLVSEPEKAIRLANKLKQRANLIPRVQKSSMKIAKSSDPISQNPQPKESGKELRDSDFLTKETRWNAGHVLKNEQENHERNNHFDNYVRRITETDTVDLKRGHVVQKISVYEGNTRDPKSQSNADTSRKRQLGVPLVGMHNACGLPVIAPWPTQVEMSPRSHRSSGRIVATLRPLPKIPLAVPAGRSRTNPKRRAPQHPSQVTAFRSPKKYTSKLRRASADRTPAFGLISAPDGSRTPRKQGKNQRRPSFKTNKMNTFPSRHSRDSSIDAGSSLTTFRSAKVEAKRRSPISGSFGRRSLKRGSAKRRTLYARDDGEEAVKVLTTLCLNPLARSKEATNMMW